MQIGNYKLIKKIGKGNYGDVYICIHNITKKKYALKIDNTKSDLKHIQYEVKMLKYLNDVDNISKVLNFGIYKNLQYLVMDIYENNLHDYMMLNEFDLKFKINLCKTILKIIKSIHESNVLHRDLKPENIMLNDENKLFFIDFGMACVYKDKHNNFISSKGSSLIGSYIYASPFSHELKELGRRDDLISLVYIYFFIFFNKLPWNINTENIIAKKKTIINSLNKNNIVLQLINILKYLYLLDFKDKPNYSLILLFINNIGETT